MTDHVSFEWAFTSYNQVFSCKQFVDIFLDGWEVLFVLQTSTKIPDSCQALLNFMVDDLWCLVWMKWYKLQPGLELQPIRWLFARRMRGVHSASLHKKPRQLSSTFEFYLLMTDHVSFGWGGTGCCQVFSCKQFSVLFSTDEQGLPSCKSNSQVLHVNATVLSLPVQVLVHPNAKAAAWWHRPQSVGRCL